MVIGRVPKPYRPCLPRCQRRPNYTRASSTPINCNASAPIPSGSDDPLAQAAAQVQGGSKSPARGKGDAKKKNRLDNGGFKGIEKILSRYALVSLGQ